MRWAARTQRGMGGQVHQVAARDIRADLQDDTRLCALRQRHYSAALCDEVIVVCTELQIRRELSTPYFHFQIPIEGVWQTMARDAACMLAFAKRTKAFFLHACLHALDLRNVVMIDSAESVTR